MWPRCGSESGWGNGEGERKGLKIRELGFDGENFSIARSHKCDTNVLKFE